MTMAKRVRILGLFASLLLVPATPVRAVDEFLVVVRKWYDEADAATGVLPPAGTKVDPNRGPFPEEQIRPFCAALNDHIFVPLTQISGKAPRIGESKVNAKAVAIGDELWKRLATTGRRETTTRQIDEEFRKVKELCQKIQELSDAAQEPALEANQSFQDSTKNGTLRGEKYNTAVALCQALRAKLRELGAKIRELETYLVERAKEWEARSRGKDYVYQALDSWLDARREHKAADAEYGKALIEFGELLDRVQRECDDPDSEEREIERMMAQIESLQKVLQRKAEQVESAMEAFDDAKDRIYSAYKDLGEEICLAIAAFWRDFF